MSETGGGTYAPPAIGYTYDHNGNRLTQTSGGTQIQAFTYNAHDVLAGTDSESETYDLNGNFLTQTLNGQYSSRTWDDEDRLTSITMPDGHTDSSSYNGLGKRLRKNDPTGYALCFGTWRIFFLCLRRLCVILKKAVLMLPCIAAAAFFRERLAVCLSPHTLPRFRAASAPARFVFTPRFVGAASR